MTAPLSIPLEPVAVPEAALPAACDVIVIGGGVIGVTTALCLAEKGLSVVLCEKGRMAAEQSARNWGWVRQMGRDLAEVPLAMRSLALWRDMNARISADTGFRQTGIAYVAYRRRDLASWDAWTATARAAGLDCHRSGGAAAQALLPGASARPLGALHMPSDGRAEPFVAVPRIAAHASNLGVRLAQNCAVRVLDVQAGRVAGVVTERGRIRADAVVLAGGVWSRPFLGNLGIDFPQLRVIASVVQVTGAGAAGEMPVGAGNWAFRRRLDGDYSVAMRNANAAPILPDNLRLLPEYLPALRSSWRELRLRPSADFLAEMLRAKHWDGESPTQFEAVRTLDPAPYTGFNRQALAALARDVPAFATARPVRHWAGVMDVTPDAVPVIGPVPQLPGLLLATGFSGHGFGIGPGAGELAADLVSGDRPQVDPHPFRLARLRPMQERAA